MRASKRAGRKRAPANEVHVSGAEGLYEESELSPAVRRYLQRALQHPRGKPDKVVITIEEVGDRPLRVPLLPVSTASCGSPNEARSLIVQMLRSLGITKKAVTNALRVVTAQPVMRGAALVRIRSGARAEPDRQRGVRVSRLGIEKSSLPLLGRRLASARLNTSIVREALTLASKVAAHPDIVAELCISDDPGYTTGYIASKQGGYVRIPHIKEPGDLRGGRIFFIREDTAIAPLIAYLETAPVIVCTGKK